jgi:hypothetical protein
MIQYRRVIKFTPKHFPMSLRLYYSNKNHFYRLKIHYRRVEEFTQKQNVALGLETEAKRQISDAVMQQYVYGKLIAPDVLACRVSPETTEESIRQYSSMFDRETLVSCFPALKFIASGEAMGDVACRVGMTYVYT